MNIALGVISIIVVAITMIVLIAGIGFASFHKFLYCHQMKCEYIHKPKWYRCFLCRKWRNQ